MANVATVSLDQLREAGERMSKVTKSVEAAQRRYPTHVEGITSITVEVARGYEVTVRL